MSVRSLLLPVETLNREFDAKLLLALHAAELGWETVIGKRSTLHDQVWRFPPSIYFSKDIRTGNGPTFRILAELGHAIVGLDEEALVNSSDEMFLMKVDPEVLGHLRAVFAWGEHDARIYRKAEGSRGIALAVTGNPRVDLLRPDLSAYFAAETADIRRRFGCFALLNTNFAMVNHFIPNQSRFQVARWVPEARAAEAKTGLLAHKTRLLRAFLDLVPRLAEGLRPHSLVIRPHPSEEHRTWLDATAGLKNVHVVHEGSVVPWLLAADLLIHNGCTSAVEAAVVGTPAVAYRPVRDSAFDNELPNRLSREFETADALLAHLGEAFDRRAGDRQQLDPGRKALLEAHIAALDGPLASARLLDELERVAADAAGPVGPASRLRGVLRLAGRRLSRGVRKRSTRAKGNPAYLRHKFPGIESGEVGRRIDRFRRTLGRFDGVAMKQIMPDLFRVRAR